MKTYSSVWGKKIPGKAKRWSDGTLVCCDAIDFLNSLHTEIADIIFLDPPFNLGKAYGSSHKKDDQKSQKEYSSFIQNVLDESIRVLKPGGALYLYHIPQWAIRFSSYLDERLLFRHWIAISMKNGFVRGDYLYPAHYALLYFTKGNPDSFNRPKISPSTCRKCGEYIKDYGGYKKYIIDGINLSDFWEDLSPVRHKNIKNRTANELPLELVNRIVRISGREGGIIVDPFIGSGTSMIAALEGGMKFLACDREESCFSTSVNRVSEYKKMKNKNH